MNPYYKELMKEQCTELKMHCAGCDIKDKATIEKQWVKAYGKLFRREFVKKKIEQIMKDASKKIEKVEELMEL